VHLKSIMCRLRKQLLCQFFSEHIIDQLVPPKSYIRRFECAIFLHASQSDLSEILFFLSIY